MQHILDLELKAMVWLDDVEHIVQADAPVAT